MHRFYINRKQIADASAVISGSDARHMASVLRLKPGDEVGLFDGMGNDYHACIKSISSKKTEVRIIQHYRTHTESPLSITVAQGYLKDRKMDGVLRQLTEMGITRWMPFIAERSVPRPTEDRIADRVKRWRKISMESVKQCRRGMIPDIRYMPSFKEMLASANQFQLKILFWEEAQDRLDANRFSDITQKESNAFIILGPEGGLTNQEVHLATNQGFSEASLGPRILKADTAAIAACAVVQYLFGDMG